MVNPGCQLDWSERQPRQFGKPASQGVSVRMALETMSKKPSLNVGDINRLEAQME